MYTGYDVMSRLSHIDEVWQFYAEYHADYGDVVKVETEKEFQYGGHFFAKRKQLYLGCGLSYADAIWCADKH